jgi:uncharacterized protein (DUF433 family)
LSSEAEAINTELRNTGTYAIAAAAHYLALPPATLSAWVRGRHYQTSRGQRHSKPLIRLPDSREPYLSFTNLVEAHVLKAIRRQHGLAMQKVRPALDHLENRMKVPHPLAHEELLTDGVSLFVERFGQLVDLSAQGQLAMQELLRVHLKRIVHDSNGFALRLFPFSRGERLEVPRVVVLDPQISFGRPVIDGTSVRTEVIASRLKAGESIQTLADDYSVGADRIEEAIRYELIAA